MSTRNQRKYALQHGAAVERIDELESAMNRVRDLHKPRWDNCLNACCSGRHCKLRTRICEGGCDEWVNEAHDYWPCATARLVYTADEIAELS